MNKKDIQQLTESYKHVNEALGDKIQYGDRKNQWTGKSALKTDVDNAVGEFLSRVLPKAIGFKIISVDNEIAIFVLERAIQRLQELLDHKKADRVIAKDIQNLKSQLGN